jgi:hypothetical protein
MPTSNRSECVHWLIMHFDKSDVIVSFGADFLSSMPNSEANSKRYVQNRNAKAGKMSRHFQFEANMSLTGSNADVRVAQKPSESTASLVALYNKVAAATGGTSISGGVDSPEVAKAAKELLAAKGKSIVLSGSNNKGEQVLVNAINSLLGNIGATIDLTSPLYLRQGNDAEFATLVADMNAGTVGALLVHGVNPSYAYADAEKFNSGLLRLNCRYLLPTAWMRPLPTQVTLLQTTIIWKAGTMRCQRPVITA